MNKIIFCLLLFPFFILAQNDQDDTLKLKAGLELSGFRQGGNVEALIFRAKSDIKFNLWKNGVFTTKNSFVYQEFGRQKADQDFLSLNFLSFYPHRRIFPLTLAFISTNFRREIDLRYLFGGGASFQVYNKNKDWLKFSLTLEYEHTDFRRSNFNRSEYNGNDYINTFRSTLWINGKYYLFKDKFILVHESYFQPSLQDINNFRWRADVGLEIPISKFFSFKISYLDTFESIVIENQKQDDNILTFGLILKNY